MLGVIIGIFLFVLGIVLYKIGFVSDGFATTISVIGIIVGLVCLFVPFAGYEEPELISEVKLSSFYEQDGKEIYAIKLDYGEVAVTYTDKEYVYGNEREIVHTEAIRAEIIEDENCKKPIVQTYREKAKRSIWCVGAAITVEEKVIVVPIGSVRK